MDGYFKIANKADVAEGTVKKFVVNGQEVAVANLDGKFFAIGDACTHKGCSLSEGTLSGENIVCPCHGGQFEMKTGKAVVPPAVMDDKTYEVKVENDDVYIKI